MSEIFYEEIDRLPVREVYHEPRVWRLDSEERPEEHQRIVVCHEEVVEIAYYCEKYGYHRRSVEIFAEELRIKVETLTIDAWTVCPTPIATLKELDTTFKEMESSPRRH